jgi:hypothetical protein
MIGLLGSVHCVGMCGGVVAAFSSAPGRRFPVAVVSSLAPAAASTLTSTRVPAGLMAGGVERATRVLAYNTGRIASYCVAGAMAGGLAGGVGKLADFADFQIGAAWLVNLMLVALGLYLMQCWRGIAYLEGVGQGLWRRVMPLIKHLTPLDSTLKITLLGALWGWLPCGMVYSMLITAMFSGSAVSGALVMLAFGLGTLPTLLTMGLLGAAIKRFAQRRPVRLAAGVLVLGFGIFGLVRTTHLAQMPAGWFDALCVRPALAAGAQ